MKGKKYMKMFPFCTRNPWSIRPTACLLQLSYHVHLFIAIHITWIPYLNVKKKNLHWRGIEPRSPAWQARILPLNHQCLQIRKTFPAQSLIKKNQKHFFPLKLFLVIKLHICEICMYKSKRKCYKYVFVLLNSLMACLFFSLIVRILV